MSRAVRDRIVEARFPGTFGADGNTISGAWEKGRNGGEWEHDFALTYRRG